MMHIFFSMQLIHEYIPIQVAIDSLEIYTAYPNAPIICIRTEVIQISMSSL